MKRRLLITTIALLALSLAAPAVWASQLSFWGQYKVNVQLTYSGGTPVTPISGVFDSGAAGYAYYPYENFRAYNNQPITPGTAADSATNLNSGTLLQTSYFSTDYNGGTTFTMIHNFVGNAPAPGYGSYGHLQQETYGSVANYSSYFSLMFEVPTAGSYTATISNIYSLVHTLENGAGGSNYFISTKGYSALNGVYATSFSEQGDPSYNDMTGTPPVYINDLRYDFSGVENFSVEGSGQSSFSVQLIDLEAGSRVALAGWLQAGQYGAGNSAVPLPPTLLLLGSGLLGLAGWRRLRKG
jgi:hypothetical protein